MTVFGFTPSPLLRQEGRLSLRSTLKKDDGGGGTAQDENKEFAGLDDFQRADLILKKLEEGKYDLPDWFEEEYGDESMDEEEEDDDPDAIDSQTLGVWDERDFDGKLGIVDWDPEVDEDPNALNPRYEYYSPPKNEDGTEDDLYDPLLGHCNPFDYRTIVDNVDSYMIDEQTRDEAMLAKDFADDDVETAFNADITQFRKSLKIIDTYVDEFLNMTLPRDVATWYGYPELVSYPEKDFYNNRFTPPENRTNFTAMEPSEARITAVQYARSKHTEWLPPGMSEAYNYAKYNEPMMRRGLLHGSTVAGECNPDLVERIRPALAILGDVAQLLSIEGPDQTVFRFHYHGLMKNRLGMAAWTETLIRDCGVDCTNVLFETGWRKRDAVEGADPWYFPY